jgi:peptidoglycan hydrolase-like protein with peptidoglycan-binding domain
MSRALVLGTAAVAAGAAVGGWAFGYGPFAHHAQPDAPVGTVPVTTATVTPGTITEREDDQGTIGYLGSFTVYSATAGTVTWLPAAGQVIRPGRRLFAVNGQDVVLMRGQAPAWRAFGPGMSDGSDVAELQRNLAALGYDPYHAITPGGHYDWATEAAIERWQAAHGWTQDGQIALGQVAFLPGPVQVAALSTGTGATVTAGTPVFAGTSTTAVVDVALPSAERYTVTAGQRVTVTLPSGSVTTGRVLGAAPATSGSPPGTSGGTGGGSGSGSGGSGSGGSGSGSGSGGQSTVSILVILNHQAAANGLNGSPVQVTIATQTQRDALVAPISALLAGPGGSYQVTVVAGSSRRDVTVQTGLFDDLDGTVAISGPGIAAGTRVEVPQS